LFANWPIDQFVASLSDVPIDYEKTACDELPKQKPTAIPFWGAPSGYDWQGKSTQHIGIAMQWVILCEMGTYLTKQLGICLQYRMGKLLG
jgi:hypothetical protein